MNLATHDVVFLFDVDNTLIDNDHVQADLASIWRGNTATPLATAIG